MASIASAHIRLQASTTLTVRPHVARLIGLPRACVGLRAKLRNIVDNRRKSTGRKGTSTYSHIQHSSTGRFARCSYRRLDDHLSFEATRDVTPRSRGSALCSRELGSCPHIRVNRVETAVVYWQDREIVVYYSHSICENVSPIPQKPQNYHDFHSSSAVKVQQMRALSSIKRDATG